MVENRIDKLGLRIKIDGNVDLVDPQNDPRYNTYWQVYHDLMARSGVSPDRARTVVRTNSTVIAALMVRQGEADSMLCGSVGPYRDHLNHVLCIAGLRPGVRQAAAMSALILPRGTLFVADTHVDPDPTAEQLADITLMAADEIQRFGIEPTVALVSHSNFGTLDTESARKMRAALALITERRPDLEVDGEMHANTALNSEIRDSVFPGSRLTAPANLLIMPTLDAANISFNMVKAVDECVSVGPMLMGLARPMHIVNQSVTVRGLVNMTAVAAVDSQIVAAERAG